MRDEKELRKRIQALKAANDHISKWVNEPRNLGQDMQAFRLSGIKTYNKNITIIRELEWVLG